MPLLGNRIHVTNPRQRRRKNDDTQDSPSFVLEETHEICTSQEELDRKRRLYQEPIWTCRCTGRSNLKHKEALKSEAAARKRLRASFPHAFEKCILETVHHCVDNLESNVSRLFKLFHQEFLIGEHVALKNKVLNKEVRGHIARIDERASTVDDSASPSQDKENRAKMPARLPHKYAIRLEDEDKIVCKIPASELVRLEKAPTREAIRLYIRGHALRYGPNFTGPWIVDDEFVRKFKLKPKLPNLVLDRNRLSIISQENELDALRKVNGEPTPKKSSAKAVVSLDSDSDSDDNLNKSDIANGHKSRENSKSPSKKKKLKQSTLLDFSAKSKLPFKSPTVTPRKNIMSQNRLPPLALKLIRLAKQDKQEQAVKILVTKCAQVLTERQVAVLPADIRERLRATQARIQEKMRLKNMTPEERETYKKEKRLEAKQKMMATLQEKKKRFEDMVLVESTDAVSLPTPQTIPLPEGLDMCDFCRVVMIAEFLCVFKSLLITSESSPTGTVNVFLLAESLVSSEDTASFRYLSNTFVLLLRTLLQDDSTASCKELGTFITEVPVTEYTALEITRLILKPKEKSVKTKKSKDADDSDELNEEVVDSSDSEDDDDFEDDRDPEMDQLLVKLEDCEFGDLSVSDKLRLLEALCDKLLRSEVLNDYIQESQKRCTETHKKRIQALKQRNDMMKEKKAKQKEEKEKKNDGGDESVNSQIEPDMSRASQRRLSMIENAKLRERKEREDRVRKQEEVERARVELTIDRADKEHETCLQEARNIMRISPLGCDRSHARYWYFRCAPGKVFVEYDWTDSAEELVFSPADQDDDYTVPHSHGNNHFVCYSTESELDELYRALLPSGVREAHLRAQLEKLLPQLRSEISSEAVLALPDSEIPSVQEFLLTGIRAEFMESVNRIRIGGLGNLGSSSRFEKSLSHSDRTSSIGELMLTVEQGLLARSRCGIFDDSNWVSSWREAVKSCSSFLRLGFLLGIMDSCVNWDKSLVNAKCQICRSKTDASQFLICDKCNKTFHSFCLRGRVTAAPTDKWFCSSCSPHTTSSRSRVQIKTAGCDFDSEEEKEQDDACLICETTDEDLVYCSSCPNAFHAQCHEPAIRRRRNREFICSDCTMGTNLRSKKLKARKSNQAKKIVAKSKLRSKSKRVYVSEEEEDSSQNEETSDEEEMPKTKAKASKHKHIAPTRSSRASKKQISNVATTSHSRTNNNYNRKIISESESESDTQRRNCSEESHSVKSEEPPKNSKRNTLTARKSSRPAFSRISSDDDSDARERKSARASSYRKNRSSLATSSTRVAKRQRGQSSNAEDPASKKRRTEAVEVNVTKICKPILDRLYRHKSAWPFHDPVSKEEAPDYYDIVDNPICLSIVRQRLEEGTVYHSVDNFLSDVALLFSNAHEYNPRGSEELDCAIQLETQVLLGILKKLDLLASYPRFTQLKGLGLL